jgi:alkylhydroperoxidase/carboxymuconolactone decarboxylase family protein YurZ
LKKEINHDSNPPRSALTLEEMGKVSPLLERYTRSAIGEGLWKRPDLASRDRGMVTVAALVARNQKRCEQKHMKGRI